jgi:hypothetical protein
MEAQLIAKIKFEQAMQFFLDIIHRFGVPNSIIMDNGTQFMKRNSLGSAMTIISTSIGSLWHTPARTGASSEQTEWFCRALS